MARRGDGIYQRGSTWWLDCRINGQRHALRIGKGISRTVAGEIARVKRAAILKGEAGIGGRKRADLPIEKAGELSKLQRGTVSTLWAAPASSCASPQPIDARSAETPR